jgi:hypothetical protein
MNCQDILDYVMSYARKDLISLKNEPLESRIQIYNELKRTDHIMKIIVLKTFRLMRRT